MRLSYLAVSLSLLALLASGCPERARQRPRRAAATSLRAETRAIVEGHAVRWDGPVRADTIAAGRDALVRLDCVRCHTVDDVPPAEPARSCVGCHSRIAHALPGTPEYAALVGEFDEATVQRYRAHIRHFVEVPDLTRVGERIRAAWIADFVRAPHDLRPMLHESMPRFAIAPKDSMVLARYFAAIANTRDPALDPDEPELGPRPSAAHIAEGERLFRQRTCNTCHTLGNVETGKTEADLETAGLPARLAPNLRFARFRMHRDVLEAWIRDPEGIHPGTHMPNLHVSAHDAARIADFILFSDPRLLPARKPPDFVLPPAATRAVSWEEVRSRVFEPHCVPCHMNNHERDPGPGNIGGFGWHAEHLRMRTYEGLVAGAGSGEGAFSVLVAREGEEMAPVLEHMLIRRVENEADHILAFRDHEPLDHGEEEPGMPIAMPALSDEEIGLVRAWLEQGCVGPVGVTGVPGVLDGYRVPDGPIEPNRGCERRDPAVVRPAWASDRDAGVP